MKKQNPQNFNITLNQELIRLTQITNQLELEAPVKINEVCPQSIPTSSQFKHRTFPSPLVVPSEQLETTEEPPFEHQ